MYRPHYSQRLRFSGCTITCCNTAEFRSKRWLGWRLSLYVCQYLCIEANSAICISLKTSRQTRRGSPQLSLDGHENCDWLTMTHHPAHRPGVLKPVKQVPDRFLSLHQLISSVAVFSTFVSVPRHVSAKCSPSHRNTAFQANPDYGEDCWNRQSNGWKGFFRCPAVPQKVQAATCPCTQYQEICCLQICRWRWHKCPGTTTQSTVDVRCEYWNRFPTDRSYCGTVLMITTSTPWHTSRLASMAALGLNETGTVCLLWTPLILCSHDLQAQSHSWSMSYACSNPLQSLFKVSTLLFTFSTL